MKGLWFRLCSMVLVMVMLINMLPLQTFATELTDNQQIENNADAALKETVSGKIVEEITDKRTEFTKQFLMDNGLFIAAVYNEAVHFEKDGKWTEIDNTLKAQLNGTYTNTAGVWNVSFPNQLTKDNRISVTKDTYTLSFGMAGELRTSGNLEIMSTEEPVIPATVPVESIAEQETTSPTESIEATEAVEETTTAAALIEETIAVEETTAATEVTEETTVAEETVPETPAEEEAVAAEETTPETTSPETVLSPSELIEGGFAETFAVTQAQTATAQLETVDIAAIKAEAEHPEMVADKLTSGLMYSNVYGTTDIRYRLNSNKVKESVILESYSSTLRGYRYTLEVGDLNPALQDDGSIHFYDAENKEIVMVMEAPFLVDAAYEYNYDVQVQLTGNGNTYTLTYLLPTAWLASTDRTWPVVLDPVISANLSASNIQDVTITETEVWDSWGMNSCGYSAANGKQRMFLRYKNLPALTSADVVIGAVITMYKYEDSGKRAVVEVHKPLNNWSPQNISWTSNSSIDSNVEDFMEVRVAGWYTWEVTDIVRSWYAGNNYGMMFKVSDSVETGGVDNFKEFISSNYGSDPSYRPSLTIHFRNNNGLESYWDYTASSAGRAGTGSVNNFTGNLVWTRGDIGFGGNLMPVSINHVYNANDAQGDKDTTQNNADSSSGNAFGLGNGWRTNYHQLVYKWSEDSDYYVWEDADGTDHYFKYNAEEEAIIDEDGLELVLTTGTGTWKYCITDKDGYKRYFDTSGRLIKLENNQATKSSIIISYSGSTKRITNITDGAGRKYNFTYNSSNLLTRISYVGNGSEEISYVSFGYSGSNLTSVTDKDGKTSTYGYGTNNLLTSATDIDGYKLIYTYGIMEKERPARVKTVTEKHNDVDGGQLTFTYQHNQTTITDRNNNKQILQFNNMGNTVCIQDGEGRAQYAQFAKNDAESTGKANQLKVASKLQYTVGNRMKYSSFEYEDSATGWRSNKAGAEISRTTQSAYLGSTSLKVTHTATSGEIYVLGPSFQINPGEIYTLSAYVKTVGPSITMGLTNTSTWATVTNVSVNTNAPWTRVELHYTNTTNAAITFSPSFCSRAAGTYYVDCIQVEKAVTASRYNLVENGDFRHSGSPALSWTGSGLGTSDVRTTSTTTAPQLDTNVFKIAGSPTAQKRLSQTVNISGGEGDSFVFAGWAKGNSVPLIKHGNNTSEFAIQMCFNYTDGSEPKYVTAQFNPDSTEWQYVAAAAVAEKAYSSVTVRLVYDYNMNVAYFDGIQLFKEQFGTSYAYDSDGNVTSVIDIQKQETTYEYTDNNLTKIIEPGSKVTKYDYDDYHNVTAAVTSTNQVYLFTYDAWGNNTSVAITYTTQPDSEEPHEHVHDTQITSSADYSDDGNRLEKTTDALEKETFYEYDPDTNVLLSVIYPEDTDATKTTYSYDSMYRMASAAVTTDTGLNLSASYTYEDDLLTSIQTASTTYDFTYGDFGLRTSVKIGDQPLATYHYNDEAANDEPEDYRNDLDRLAYGNGDMLLYEYDDQGRVTKQTYENGDTVSYQYDNSGALATVTDSATGRKTTYYYDLTDRMVKYVESGTGYNHSVGYEYNAENNLTSLVETINGTDYTTSYTYDDDNRVTSMTTDGTTVAYTYDAYGRISTQVTKRGSTTILTETYTYVNPTSSTTSSQIATYKTESANYSVTYSYTYDDNGNILSVTDGTYPISYEYDSANQVIRENNRRRNRTLVWTYDNAGNILSEKVYVYTTGDISNATPMTTNGYTYGDEGWGDLLTGYNNLVYTHDEIGNPAGDTLRSYTWEHGRQLESLTLMGNTWDYTYDANGLRTKRSSDSVTYEYIYSGDKLVQVIATDHTTTPETVSVVEYTYDVAGQPLTMTLGEDVYYYVLNVQGDVVGLVDSTGTLMISYIYEGYGECYSLSNTSDKAPLMSANNHLLYRGYVMDKGTGLYYLQSRYYDPNVGRFINADAFASTGQGIIGNNMFAYCGNNPVMFADSSGTARIPCTVVINDGDRSEKKKRKFANYVERADQKSSIFDYDFGPFGKIGLYFVATTTTQEEGFIYAFNDIECEGEGLGSDWAYEVGVGTNICDLMGASFGASTELNIFGEIQFLNTHRRISTGIDGIGYTTGIDIFNCAFELEIEGGVGSWLLAALFNPANKWDEWYFVPIPV